MSTTIHRFRVDVIDVPTALPLPATAPVVHVAPDRSDPDRYLEVWAIVDTEQPLAVRHFVVTGTGHPVAAGLIYIGTSVTADLVWHLWEAVS